MSSTDISHIHEFLHCQTPADWVQCALENQTLMLIDHANCEHAAGQSAMTAMKRYRGGIPGIANSGMAGTRSGFGVDYSLLTQLSRLAREELRHFEQVVALMRKRDIDYEQITASRYAGRLRDEVRTTEPGRLVDTLIVGAVIEARSCERFAALAPVLDEELSDFYASLLKSECRHFADYLNLAKGVAGSAEVEERLQNILAVEKVLIESGDTEFRFHSGVPKT
ncbi:MAG: tRNA-(ms[2]io[6]A)-hydroxylase [Alcanivorax sp.]|jgi:tRNA-(ms[2]io[6]A)-hydroxylase